MSETPEMLADLALRVLGRHDCGGVVELVEYAAICSRCGAQDWHDDLSGPYVADLLERTQQVDDAECLILAKQLYDEAYARHAP